MARYATIFGTGHYLPENEITNATFAGWMGAVSPKLAEVVGKFEASSGIKTRFYAPDDWATSDLAVEAGKKRLRMPASPQNRWIWSLSAPTARITSRQLLRWLCSTSLAASMPVPGILAALARLFRQVWHRLPV
jgi:3-oxoacyl-[acyl-carrier-protein] synthase III